MLILGLIITVLFRIIIMAANMVFSNRLGELFKAGQNVKPLVRKTDSLSDSRTTTSYRMALTRHQVPFDAMPE